MQADQSATPTKNAGPASKNIPAHTVDESTRFLEGYVLKFFDSQTDKDVLHALCTIVELEKYSLWEAVRRSERAEALLLYAGLGDMYSRFYVSNHM